MTIHECQDNLDFMTNVTLVKYYRSFVWIPYFFQSFSADLHMEGSSARVLLGHISFATLKIVPPTPLTTERSSAWSSTANSSEDGTTPGGHTLEWMVRLLFHESRDVKSAVRFFYVFPLSEKFVH